MQNIAEKLCLAAPALRNVLATAQGLILNRQRYAGIYSDSVTRILERERWTAEQMRDYQEQRLREIIAVAAHHVPFYRDLFRKIGLSPRDFQSAADLRKLPVLEKDCVRAEPLRFVNERYDPRQLHCETTTGTTGTPIRVWLTSRAIQESYAFYEARCRRVAGVRYRQDPFVTMGVRRVAAIDRTGPPFWCYNYAGKQLYMSVYHLAPQYLVHYCAELARRPYRAIAGYPSVLAALAQFVLDRGIRDLRIPAAITSGETLHPRQRRLIEEAFAARVYDQFGCSELCVFAAEAACGAMHLSPDYGLVEILDDSGEPVPRGQTGQLVCTGLLNQATVLLRYRLGDTASLARDPCACGSALPVLRSVDGRTANAIVLPDGRRLFRMGAIDAEIPSVKLYQIVQQDVGVFTIYVVPAAGFRPTDEATMIANLAASVGPARIRVQRVASIRRGPGGKFASVLSRVGAPRQPAGLVCEES